MTKAATYLLLSLLSLVLSLLSHSPLVSATTPFPVTFAPTNYTSFFTTVRPSTTLPNATTTPCICIGTAVSLSGVSATYGGPQNEATRVWVYYANLRGGQVVAGTRYYFLYVYADDGSMTGLSQFYASLFAASTRPVFDVVMLGPAAAAIASITAIAPYRIPVLGASLSTQSSFIVNGAARYNYTIPNVSLTGARQLALYTQLARLTPPLRRVAILTRTGSEESRLNFLAAFNSSFNAGTATLVLDMFIPFAQATATVQDYESLLRTTLGTVESVDLLVVAATFDAPLLGLGLAQSRITPGMVVLPGTLGSYDAGLDGWITFSTFDETFDIVSTRPSAVFSRTSDFYDKFRALLPTTTPTAVHVQLTAPYETYIAALNLTASLQPDDIRAAVLNATGWSIFNWHEVDPQYCVALNTRGYLRQLRDNRIVVALDPSKELMYPYRWAWSRVLAGDSLSISVSGSSMVVATLLLVFGLWVALILTEQLVHHTMRKEMFFQFLYVALTALSIGIGALWPFNLIAFAAVTISCPDCTADMTVSSSLALSMLALLPAFVPALLGVALYTSEISSRSKGSLKSANGQVVAAADGGAGAGGDTLAPSSLRTSVSSSGTTVTTTRATTTTSGELTQLDEARASTHKRQAKRIARGQAASDPAGASSSASSSSSWCNPFVLISRLARRFSRISSHSGAFSRTLRNNITLRALGTGVLIAASVILCRETMVWALFSNATFTVRTDAFVLSSLLVVLLCSIAMIVYFRSQYFRPLGVMLLALAVVADCLICVLTAEVLYAPRRMTEDVPSLWYSSTVSTTIMVLVAVCIGGLVGVTFIALQFNRVKLSHHAVMMVLVKVKGELAQTRDENARMSHLNRVMQLVQRELFLTIDQMQLLEDRAESGEAMAWTIMAPRVSYMQSALFASAALVMPTLLALIKLPPRQTSVLMPDRLLPTSVASLDKSTPSPTAGTLMLIEKDQTSMQEGSIFNASARGLHAGARGSGAALTQDLTAGAPSPAADAGAAAATASSFTLPLDNESTNEFSSRHLPLSVTTVMSALSASAAANRAAAAGGAASNAATTIISSAADLELAATNMSCGWLLSALEHPLVSDQQEQLTELFAQLPEQGRRLALQGDESASASTFGAAGSRGSMTRVATILGYHPTLQCILSHPTTFMLLKGELERSHCGENALFLREVAKWRQVTYRPLQYILAHALCRVFVLNDSVCEVNVSAAQRTRILQTLRSSGRQSLTRSLFDAAEAEVISLIMTNNWNMFVTSRVYSMCAQVLVRNAIVMTALQHHLENVKAALLPVGGGGAEPSDVSMTKPNRPSAVGAQGPRAMAQDDDGGGGGVSLPDDALGLPVGGDREVGGGGGSDVAMTDLVQRKLVPVLASTGRGSWSVASGAGPKGSIVRGKLVSALPSMIEPAPAAQQQQQQYEQPGALASHASASETETDSSSMDEDMLLPHRVGEQ